MAKTRQEKEDIVNSLSDKLGKIKSLIVVNYQGLSVNEDQELRKKMKDEKIDYVSLKKTLFNKAAEKAGLEVDTKDWQSSIAAAFSYEDEVIPARIIKDFRKEEREEKIDFIGGVLESKYISKEEVDKLSLIPSKNELYAKMVGSLNAPISGLVNVLAGNIRGLVNVLNSIKESKS